MNTNNELYSGFSNDLQELLEEMNESVINSLSPREMVLREAALDIDTDFSSQFYTEAVFASGKTTTMPLVEHIQKIKDLLDEQIAAQNKSIKEGKGSDNKGSSFDPKAFWKNEIFKEFEDKIMEIFGFRNVEIHPYIEKYNSKTKTFESKILNCEIYCMNRYPIEGLVTEKGFFDKSKSLTMQIFISLGLLKNLNAEEVMAIFLHEFGHGIDPALMDIKYTQVNILSKYLTDRKGALNKAEKKFLEKHKLSDRAIVCLLSTSVLFLSLGIAAIKKFINFLVQKFGHKDETVEEKLEKIRKMVAEDKSRFNRQNFAEAYADNFARMYGYGPQLMSSLKKMEKDQERGIKSRHALETDRQDIIIYITIDAIKNGHKTDLHRIRNLIKEYKDDINDPNTSPVVKKQLQEDLAELEKILHEYTNNFSEFQNRVNRVINEELEKIEISDEKKSSYKSHKRKDDEEKSKDPEEEESGEKEEKAALVKEGFVFFDESTDVFEEKKHPLQEKMEKKCPLDHGDRSKIDEKFGKSKACSWAKDKDGYFCYTHRCRSKSYSTIDDIPQKDVDFVRSTS